MIHQKRERERYSSLKTCIRENKKSITLEFRSKSLFNHIKHIGAEWIFEEEKLACILNKRNKKKKTLHNFILLDCLFVLKRNKVATIISRAWLLAFVISFSRKWKKKKIIHCLLSIRFYFISLVKSFSRFEE